MGGTILTRARLLVPLYAVISCVLTWPLIAHLTTSITYGDEPTGTVPLASLWAMRWNQEQVGDLYRNYWDAPIFHPNDGTFALSEAGPLTGLAFTPISWLTGNPVLAFNLVFLAIFTLNGYAAARLASRLGAAPAPAALTGVLAVGLSFVANEMGVLPLTVVFPLIFLIEAIVSWAPEGGRWAAASIGAWLAVTFLTSGQYGLFALLGIGLPALVLVRRDWLSRSRLTDLAIAGAVFAVAAGPFLIDQARLTSGYTRSVETITRQSANSWEYKQLVPAAHGSDVMPWLDELQRGHGLYPGTALLLLAFLGFWVGGTSNRAIPRFLLTGAVVSWLLSLALNLRVLGFQPYELIRQLPSYGTLRSPFRFAALFELFLLALAAYGLHVLWRWRPSLPRGPSALVFTGPAVAVLVVVLGVAEVSIAPVRLFEVDRSPPDWAVWMREEAPSPPVAGDGAIAFLPFPPGTRAADYEATTRRMLHALDAGAPTVNGYSSHWPSDSAHLEDVMSDYPNLSGDAELRAFGVSYLVVDPGWLTEAPARAAWLEREHTRVFTGDAVVYEVRP